MIEDVPASELSGQNLDAEVAEQVMGWYVEYHAEDEEWWTDEDGNRLRRQEEWSPSSDISNAREVREKLREQGWDLSIESRVAVVSEAKHASGPPWEASFIHPDGKLEARGRGDTAPEAICRAALRVVGEAY